MEDKSFEVQKRIKRVVFVSNFLNHHQIPLCEAFIKRCDEFFFVATNIAGRGGYTGGYQKSTERKYVVHFFLDKERDYATALIMEADVVIFGVCPPEMIKKRTNIGKLSFIYSERFFRHSRLRMFIPTTMKSIYERALKYRGKNFFVLCASAYMPYDLSVFRFPLNKCFKWGYFPEVKQYDDINKIIESKKANSILWVSRFLKLKHPEVPIQVAYRLKKEGYSFILNMIGDGDKRQETEELVAKYNLNDRICFLGSKTPEEVRLYMEQSEVFLFTSDKQEGWGAVLNESMNSACAVVACKAIGSVPYLIEDGINGFQYSANKNLEEIIDKVKHLLDNPEERRIISRKAYLTLINNWHPDVAVDRLLHLSEELLQGKDAMGLFEDGPCSRAELIKG